MEQRTRRTGAGSMVVGTREVQADRHEGRGAWCEWGWRPSEKQTKMARTEGVRGQRVGGGSNRKGHTGLGCDSPGEGEMDRTGQQDTCEGRKRAT